MKTNKNREARRKAEIAAQQAAKARRMHSPSGDSDYARKKRDPNRKPAAWEETNSGGSPAPWDPKNDGVYDSRFEGGFAPAVLPGTGRRTMVKIVNGQVLFG